MRGGSEGGERGRAEYRDRHQHEWQKSAGRVRLLTLGSIIIIIDSDKSQRGPHRHSYVGDDGCYCLLAWLAAKRGENRSQIQQTHSILRYTHFTLAKHTPRQATTPHHLTVTRERVGGTRGGEEEEGATPRTQATMKTYKPELSCRRCCRCRLPWVWRANQTPKKVTEILIPPRQLD